MKVLNKVTDGDNSAKFLFALDDGNTIETLHMHDRDNILTYHSTVCVSSQVGCAMNCKFCATGMQGLVRDLTVSEIMQQISFCSEYCMETGKSSIDAIVFAGMGEPLLNYENVKEAIFNIKSEFNINHFELATSGVVPGIYKLIEDFRDKDMLIRLNLSLHATTDEKRKFLVPLTKKYGINEIITAAVDYGKAFGMKTRIRYMLIKGINDSSEDVENLNGLLAEKPVKLVISGYNDNNIEGLAAPSEKDIVNFCGKIGKNINCEIFHNFGSSINAGCGQLRQTEVKGMAWPRSRH